MRRLLLILVVACLSIGAKAQVRSLGVTLGPYEAVTLQHWVYGTDNIFQLDLGYHTGVPSGGSIRMMAAYNIPILSPQWTEKGTWNFYAGPGIYIGGSTAPGKGLNFGVIANVGIEYIFDSLPILLSAEMRPGLGTMFSNDDFIYDIDNLLDLIPMVSVRYMF